MGNKAWDLVEASSTGGTKEVLRYSKGNKGCLRPALTALGTTGCSLQASMGCIPSL